MRLAVDLDTRIHGCDRDEVCARLDSVTISQNITESTVGKFKHSSPSNIEEATLGLIKTKNIHSYLYLFPSTLIRIFYFLCV